MRYITCVIQDLVLQQLLPAPNGMKIESGTTVISWLKLQDAGELQLWYITIDRYGFSFNNRCDYYSANASNMLAVPAYCRTNRIRWYATHKGYQTSDISDADFIIIHRSTLNPRDYIWLMICRLRLFTALRQWIWKVIPTGSVFLNDDVGTTLMRSVNQRLKKAGDYWLQRA